MNLQLLTMNEKFPQNCEKKNNYLEILESPKCCN